MYEALSYECMGPEATSVCGLKLPARVKGHARAHIVRRASDFTRQLSLTRIVALPAAPRTASKLGSGYANPPPLSG